MDHTLIDQIALTDHPDDEEAVENILRTLLVPPVISLQAAAADYVSVLVLGGYCSVGALQTLEQDNMVAVGIPPGHAQRILRAIRVQEPQVQSQPAGQVPQLPASVAQAYQSNSSGKAAAVTSWAALSGTGYPTAVAWRVFKPKLSGHMRSRTDPEMHRRFEQSGSEFAAGPTASGPRA